MTITIKNLQSQFVISQAVMPDPGFPRSGAVITTTIDGAVKTLPLTVGTIPSNPLFSINGLPGGRYELVAPSADSIYTVGTIDSINKYYLWSPASTYNVTTKADWPVVPGADVGVFKTDDTAMQIQGKTGALVSTSQFFVDLTRPLDPNHWVSNTVLSKTLTNTDPLARMNNWESSLAYAEKQTPVSLVDATVTVTPRTTANGSMQSLASFTIASLQDVVDIRNLTGFTLFDATMKPVGITEVRAADYGVSTTYTGKLFKYYVVPMLDGDYAFDRPTTATTTTKVPVQILKLVQGTGKGGVYYTAISIADLAREVGVITERACRNLQFQPNIQLLAEISAAYSAVVKAELEQNSTKVLNITDYDTIKAQALTGMVTGIVGSSVGGVGMILAMIEMGMRFFGK